jgi:hypothetical protein
MIGELPHSAFLLVEMWACKLFLPELVSNYSPRYLCFLSSWDYRYELLSQAYFFMTIYFLVIIC